jgi:hypothetical protein
VAEEARASEGGDGVAVGPGSPWAQAMPPAARRTMADRMRGAPMALPLRALVRTNCWKACCLPGRTVPHVQCNLELSPAQLHYGNRGAPVPNRRPGLTAKPTHNNHTQWTRLEMAEAATSRPQA